MRWKEIPRRLQIAMVCLLIVGMVIGFGLGYQKGAKDTLHLGINVANALIDKGKLNIELDPQMIENAWFQYEQRIGGCLFLENDTIYNG